ncbi:MAG: hypothetical protein K9I82_01725 [Chitinophagaceae bacterium]|nr:hypothetical protein [Chitinophagaceae bacterium]
MKNIHILATDKPSRLHSYKGVLNLAAGEFVAPPIVKNDLINLNIYITNDEEIKDVRPHKGKWHLEEERILNKFPDYLTDLSECKLVIMTTDQSLIQDGIQAIDDEFLEFFVKNPSCESVKWNAYPISPNGNIVGTNRPYPFEGLISNFKIEYKIIIPNLEIPEFGTKEFNDLASGFFGGKPRLKEESKQEKLAYTESARKEERISNCTIMKSIRETVEEAAERLWLDSTSQLTSKNSFIEGAEWQAERMYSEEDLISFARFYFREEFNSTMQNSDKSTDEILQEWFNQFKKK